MKATILFCLMISIIIAGCAPQKSSPIEGAWKIVYGTWVRGDTVMGTLPGTWKGAGMKMWSKGHFAFVGRYGVDTSWSDSYGGGSYSLEGNRYQENIQFHTWKAAVGDSVKMLMEIKNDTLVQTWPLLENGQIDKSNFRQEKYIRMD